MRLVALAAAGLVTIAGAAIAQPVLTMAPGETLLSIEAQGRELSRPDVMTVTAGVVTTGSRAADALAANNALAGKLVDAVRGTGVAASDVRTSSLSINPQIEDGERAEREGRAPRIRGYLVTNNLELRLRDLSKASSVLDALIAAGANNVQGPRFSLADAAPAERAAERAAILDARAKADNYAAALGKRVVRVIRVSERRTYGESGGDEIIVTGSRTRGTPIESGELTTNASVFVDFAIADR